VDALHREDASARLRLVRDDLFILLKLAALGLLGFAFFLLLLLALGLVWKGIIGQRVAAHGAEQEHAQKISMATKQPVRHITSQVKPRLKEPRAMFLHYKVPYSLNKSKRPCGGKK